MSALTPNGRSRIIVTVFLGNPGGHGGPSVTRDRDTCPRQLKPVHVPCLEIVDPRVRVLARLTLMPGVHLEPV